ncbi:MAG: TatD family deoxyribonuclease [Promethearchaeota archaeon]|nr:MAG: TatD family deoxyribonuclease [Candidatus Lokiarchaeota archaeon]
MLILLNTKRFIKVLIDVHCHLNLYLNPNDVIKEAKQAGVEKIIAVAMSTLSQKRVLEISKKYDSVYPALGIHPEEVKMNKHIEDELNGIEDLIMNKRSHLCAIGEIGLDHHFIKEKNLYPLQLKILKRMLSIAKKLQLPVNLHTKGAESIIFETLPSYEIPNVNLHWYSGPEELLKVGIDRGYYFSITPAIKYSPSVKKTVSLVDIDRLLLESDGPVKFSGIPGTPAMIKEVLYEISSLKKVSPAELKERIRYNTKNVFPVIFSST